MDAGKATGRKVSNLYDSTRNRARNLVGIDNRVNRSWAWGNALEAGFMSLAGEDKVYLGEGAIDLIRADPKMVAFEQGLVDAIKDDPRYMNESFSPELRPEELGFGGETAPYPKRVQVRAPWKPEYRDTWRVAANERTWLVRNVTLFPSVYVSKNGSIIINYHFVDELDLRPDWENRSDEYNYITTVLGFFWHDIARGTKMDIEANWTSTYPPQQ